MKSAISGPSSATLVEFATEEKALAAIARLKNQPDVLFLERNGIVQIPPQPQFSNVPRKGSKNAQDAAGSGVTPNAVSTDPGTGFQYHLTVIRKTAALPALSITPPTVAVIDFCSPLPS